MPNDDRLGDFNAGLQDAITNSHPKKKIDATVADPVPSARNHPQYWMVSRGIWGRSDFVHRPSSHLLCVEPIPKA
jgi:hypothetical protein